MIEIHIGHADQLFNTIDPSPFHEKDLSREVEDFIVGWARDLPREQPPALQVWIDRPPPHPDAPAVVRDAIQRYFKARGMDTRRALRRLFRNGRVSLLIGLAVLAIATLASTLVERDAVAGLGLLLRESLLVGGWVAMWRPLEIFLYDWWPIRADARLFDRLSTMPVTVSFEHAARHGA